MENAKLKTPLKHPSKYSFFVMEQEVVCFNMWKLFLCLIKLRNPNF